MFAIVRSPSASRRRVVTKCDRVVSSTPSGRFAPSLTALAELSKNRAMRSKSGRGTGTRKSCVSAVIMPSVERLDNPSVSERSSRLLWATFNASAGAAAGNFCAEPATMFPFCRHDSELLAVMVLCCNVSLFSPLLDRGARESEAENGRVNRDSGEGTAACAGRIRAAESERSSYRRRHVIIVLKSILSRFFDVRIVCSLIG